MCSSIAHRSDRLLVAISARYAAARKRPSASARVRLLGSLFPPGRGTALGGLRPSLMGRAPRARRRALPGEWEERNRVIVLAQQEIPFVGRDCVKIDDVEHG